MELAIATHTAPAQWIGEPDEVLATALEVLADQAEQISGHRRKRRK